MTELIESKEREKLSSNPATDSKEEEKVSLCFYFKQRGETYSSWNMKTGISSDYEKAIAECRNTETK